MTGLVMVGDDGVACDGDACVLPTTDGAGRPQATGTVQVEAPRAPTTPQSPGVRR